MARHSGKNKVSEETRNKAMLIAKGTQTPGQTKAQTKLIAQGIERGIDLYKKEQKEKARAQDKRQREKRQQETSAQNSSEAGTGPDARAATSPFPWLPWTLLVATWAGIGIYWFTRTA